MVELFMNMKEIKKLVDLVEEAQVSRLSVETPELKIEVRKELNGVPQVITELPAQAVQAAAPVAAAPATPAAPAAPVDDTAGLIPLKSEMVGTFYGAPNPDSDAYTKVGSAIQSGQVVCIIEAMKLFNEIESDVSGTVEKICVKDGESVEFGQTLFLLRP